MNCDKTLREIWSSADQEYIDAMQESRKAPHNSKGSNHILSFNDWCNAQEKKTVTTLEYDMKNGFSSHQIPNQLKNHDSSHPAEIKISGNAALPSIWAPTKNDNFIKTDKSNNPASTFKCAKQEPLDPKNLMRNEANDSYESVSSSDSESELSNNCGSQDELNEETFGKFAAIPEEFRPNESDLSELSEKTMLWDMNVKNRNSTADSSFTHQLISASPNSNCSTKKITNNEKPSTQHTKSKTFRKRSNPRSDLNFSIKPAQQNRSFHSKFRSNHVEKEIIPPVKRGMNSSKALPANFSSLTIDYETLNPKQKIETRTTWETNRIKKCSPNSLKYHRIPPKVNFKETLEVKTREIIERRGDSGRFQTQKITYVQGKVVDKVSSVRNIRQDKIKWDNNIAFSTIEKEATVVRGNNSSYHNTTKGRNNKIQWNSSVDKYLTISHICSNNDNLRCRNGRVENNGGARPKDLNSYKGHNSYSRANPTKKETTALPRSHSEYLNVQENNNFDSNKGLFFEANCDEMRENNYRDKGKHDNLEKESINLIHSKFCVKENSENRLSWNIIDSERNEEINASKPGSTRIESTNDEVMQNNIILSEKRDYETALARDKFLFSRFNENNLTTPKVGNLHYENNFINGKNDKTNKLYSSAKEKLSPSFDLKLYHEVKKSELIKYAKDMADLFTGCERALTLFKSFYDEWATNRHRSIGILEQIVEIIKSSSKRSQTIRNILGAINLAANIGDAASTDKTVSVGLKITSAVVGALSKLVGNGISKKDLEAKEFEIKEVFQQDMDASSSVYIYSLQCCTLFQETCSLVSKFHQSIQNENFTSVTDDEGVKEFLSEISEYNPSNFIVFYRRLRLGYEKLMLSSKSTESKAFCRVLEDVPEAVNVINLLPWRFDVDGFDQAILQRYWQELFDFLGDSECKNVDEFLRKIQECLFFLKKERSLLELAVRNLFKEESFGKQKL